MKAKELMIGDWVRTSDGYGQVIQICYTENKLLNMQRQTVCVEYAAENRYAIFNEDDIAPILLTSERLEKNHFYTNNDNIWWMKEFVRYAPISLRSLPSGGYCLEMCDDDLGIKYVHELQHVLRLCRLTERANNFIV